MTTLFRTRRLSSRLMEGLDGFGRTPTPDANTSMDTDSLVDTVIRTVAVYANKEPEELPPLNSVIDADALEALFGPRLDGTSRQGSGEVRFRYAGYMVRVSADGDVQVEPAHERD